jgi:hypothetical protein
MMSGKRSRDKGARFERFLVGVLKTCFPDAHRGQQAHNPRHCDVEGTPFRIEAKSWAKLTYKNVTDAIEQAEENGERFNDERIPVGITKLTGGDTFVHLRLARFVQLVEKHFYSEPELADVIPIKGVKDE